MTDLLELAARYIDGGGYEGPGSVNRITGELTEVAGGIAMVEAFSHVVAFRTDAGLTLFDVSLAPFAPAAVRALRSWAEEPVHTVVYTHGHVDHVGGMAAFLRDADERGNRGPWWSGTRTCPGGSTATTSRPGTTR